MFHLSIGVNDDTGFAFALSVSVGRPGPRAQLLLELSWADNHQVYRVHDVAVTPEVLFGLEDTAASGTDIGLAVTEGPQAFSARRVDDDSSSRGSQDYPVDLGIGSNTITMVKLLEDDRPLSHQNPLGKGRHLV